ncbi:MAG: hypothetical protein HQL72_10390 [Magnetococcales bacterium]|nr:hypothetical protein [Magnetococcales bacterium]
MKGQAVNNQAGILHDLLLAMGKMQGVLETIQRRQQEQTQWMGKLDERLRTVERKAALNGMLAGGMIGVVMGILGHFFKSLLGLDG